jgi:hypothetical protein
VGHCLLWGSDLKITKQSTFWGYFFHALGYGLILTKKKLGYILSIFLTNSGVDILITIFCDFCQFSATKLAFFLNTNVTIKYFSKFSFVLSPKRQYLC